MTELPIDNLPVYIGDRLPDSPSSPVLVGTDPVQPMPCRPVPVSEIPVEDTVRQDAKILTPDFGGDPDYLRYQPAPPSRVPSMDAFIALAMIITVAMLAAFAIGVVA